ncbi:group III truncated hemoglobin [uncultured Campylobacter sp.]|uniref:group III truncated hemoglobin n=1 Tax=uncultured Campylobacter sp. TaxID=218934 RepID=UPI00262EF45D|nr:group III truncated hemoglobin [uncultured Campylobacter sp.]
MKYNTINKEAIDKFMELFYEKVRKDKDIGAIFNAKIGTDDESWKQHKVKISNFWQGMMLGEGDYNGQPLKAHMELEPFPIEFFNIWLDIFEQSLDKVFDEDMKAVFLQRAQMIAKNFKNALYRGA